MFPKYFICVTPSFKDHLFSISFQPLLQTSFHYHWTDFSASGTPYIPTSPGIISSTSPAHALSLLPHLIHKIRKTAWTSCLCAAPSSISFRHNSQPPRSMDYRGNLGNLVLLCWRPSLHLTGYYCCRRLGEREPQKLSQSVPAGDDEWEAGINGSFWFIKVILHISRGSHFFEMHPWHKCKLGHMELHYPWDSLFEIMLVDGFLKLLPFYLSSQMDTNPSYMGVY